MPHPELAHIQTTGIAEAWFRPELHTQSRVAFLDVEGPLLKGDFAMHLASKYIRPQNPKDENFDYGAEFFKVFYDVYTQDTKQRRVTNYAAYHKELGEQAQPQLLENAAEGTSIISTLLPFWLEGIDTETLLQEAKEHMDFVPGAKELVTNLKKRGFTIVAATTSFRETTAHMLEELPIDHVIGTPLALKEVQTYLQKDPEVFEEEKIKIQTALEEVFSAMDTVQEADTETKEDAQKNLTTSMQKFYTEALGISYEPAVGVHTAKPTGLLAEIFRKFEVVTDYRKGQAARIMAENKNIVIRIADGSNDIHHLTNEEQGRYGEPKHIFTIACNAHPLAVQVADFGVVTEDMNELTPLIDTIIQYGAHLSPFHIVDIAQQKTDRAMLHVGGGKYGRLTQELFNKHQLQRDETRKNQRGFRA